MKFFNQNILLKSFAGITVFAAVMLAGLFTSCVRIEESQDNADSAYICFSSVTVDYQVKDLMPTKATVPSDDMPGPEDFTIKISGENIDDMIFEPGSIPSEPVKVYPGTYLIEAIYGTNAFGSPYFYKSETIELSDGQNKTVSLTDIPLANAMVALVLPDNLSQHLELTSLQLTDGTVTISVEHGKYVYVPSGRDITVTFAGTNSIDEYKQISVQLGVLQQQRAYDVECSLSLPQIVLPSQTDGAWGARLYVTPATVASSLSGGELVYEVIAASSSDWENPLAESEVLGDYHMVDGLENGSSYKVRARVGNVVSNVVTFTVEDPAQRAECVVNHTYDSNGYLTGTSVTADLKLTGILATLRTAGLLETEISLSKGDVVYRTLSDSYGVLSDNSNWPYLPKGDGYDLEVKHGISGETGVVDASPVEVPVPVIKTDVSAYTTYDRYLDYKSGQGTLNLANNYDKRLIVEDRKAILKISNEIIRNEKYSSLLTHSSVTYAGGALDTFVISTTASNTLTYSNVSYTDVQWGAYELKSSVYFDGVLAEDSHMCWITGLPYSRDFTETSDITGWSFDGEYNYLSRYSKGYVIRYYYKKIWSVNQYSSNVFSPKFKSPSSGIETGYSATFYFGETGLSTKADITANIGLTTETSVVKSKSATFTEYSSYLTTSSHVESILSTSGKIYDNYRVSISTDNANYPSTTEHYGVLAKFKIEYE